MDQKELTMLHAEQVEELIRLVSALDRAILVTQIQDFRGTFPVDFTPDFLNNIPLDRLKHIFLALCLQTQRLPSIMEQTAA
jgi:hypothetical protein